MDTALNIFTIVAPFLGLGAFGVFLKKSVFYYRVVKQAVATFEEIKEANLTVYNHVCSDPEKKELAHVLSGGIKRIEGLTGIKKK